MATARCGGSRSSRRSERRSTSPPKSCAWRRSSPPTTTPGALGPHHHRYHLTAGGHQPAHHRPRVVAVTHLDERATAKGGDGRSTRDCTGNSRSSTRAWAARPHPPRARCSMPVFPAIGGWPTACRGTSGSSSGSTTSTSSTTAGERPDRSSVLAEPVARRPHRMAHGHDRDPRRRGLSRPGWPPRLGRCSVEPQGCCAACLGTVLRHAGRIASGMERG